MKSWGVLTQKKPKKPVATPKSVNWHWFFLFFLVFFGFFKFPNWHCIGFFWFFWFFFGFFWHWFWPEFEIGNWFFFGFFLAFFGIGLGQHSKLETGFLGSVGFFWFFFGFFLVFFWYLNLGLEYHPKKYQKKPNKTKKTLKKPKKNQSLHQNW